MKNIDKIIQESIKHVLMEDYGHNLGELPYEVESYAQKLHTYANQLEGFIQDYQAFVVELLKRAQELGLTVEDDIDEEELEDRKSYTKEIIFNVYDTNPNPDMSDEEYEARQDHIVGLMHQLELVMSRDFDKKYEVRFTDYENTISVQVTFGFWD